MNKTQPESHELGTGDSRGSRGVGARLFDLVPSVLMAVVVYVVRDITTTFIHKLCIDSNKVSKKTASKLRDSIYFCMQYTALALVSGYTLRHSGYYQDPYEMFRTLPNTLTKGVRICYIIELSVYIAGSLVLLSPKEEETSRKKYSDTGKMWVHHAATVSLLSVSYLTGHTTIGVLVMHLHDVCDIIIEFTKTLKYLIGVRLVTVLMFVVILLVFLYNRGYVFVRDVLWHIIIGYPQALPESYVGPVKVVRREEYRSWVEYFVSAVRNFLSFPAPMIVCELLLFALEILNLMWIVNLVQILLHYISTGVAGDIRDPDERKEMEMKEREKEVEKEKGKEESENEKERAKEALHKTSLTDSLTLCRAQHTAGLSHPLALSRSQRRRSRISQLATRCIRPGNDRRGHGAQPE